MAIVVRGTAYGYYVTDAAGTTLLFACRFAMPLDFTNLVPSHDLKATINAMPTSDPGSGPIMDDALVSDLEAFVAINPNMKMHLYQNNYTPSTSSVLANFTEATWAGYNAQVLASWDAAAIIAPHFASKASHAVTFIST